MKLTEAQRLEIWSELDNDGLSIPCLGERLPEGLDRGILIDPPPLPFGLLPDVIRVPAFLWLIENVTTTDTGPAVYISSEELNCMLEAGTGITLTDTQVREALLLLGIEPWDAIDWVYRLHKGCPAAANGASLHLINHGA